MRESISEVAELGAQRQGAKIIAEPSRQAMRAALAEIRNGEFDRQLQAEMEAGFPALQQGRRESSEHLIEQVGRELRAQMPWLR